ncbi:homeodomain-interacting protein kinase 1-like [Pseudoliparis swirei]|uniref:homeodomain-interacting protein kinase 1-like n=1 Tax=Pseudoliparis swirei TaxID=2059687 RepID=UPI0024BE5065|nr:homeodomain-interacting protein kinase 1-like [Pseudoliparis swirei]
MDSDQSNLVEWYGAFTCNQYFCLEFEHLDKSLLDFMKDRSFQPLLLKEIRPIVKQVANALDYMKAAAIIHADIKFENIMLVNHAQEPYRLKVIDFGLAHEVSDAAQGARIQSLPYRSPEILLGLPYTEATDMWSLGCIAASLYLGCFLYPGRTEYDMVRYIVETQGHPSDTLLTPGLTTDCFFQYDGNSKNRIWKLKTPAQIFRETGIPSRENRLMKFSSLYHILKTQRFRSKTTVDKCAESSDRLIFGDLLRGMLEFDAAKRLSPRQVLEHQFTSMQHMVSRYHLSPYVQSCSEIMDLGQNRETEINKIPKDLPDPSTSSVKRKMADDDNSDRHQLSSPETKRVRKNSAAPSTSSSSSCFPPSVKTKMADDDDSDHHQFSCPKTKRVQKPEPEKKDFNLNK